MYSKLAGLIHVPSFSLDFSQTNECIPLASTPLALVQRQQKPEGSTAINGTRHVASVLPATPYLCSI